MSSSRFAVPVIRPLKKDGAPEGNTVPRRESRRGHVGLFRAEVSQRQVEHREGLREFRETERRGVFPLLAVVVPPLERDVRLDTAAARGSI
jgi:hypothetical protein